MRSARILAVLCCATLVSALAPGRADGDTIRFTHGGARKCVIIEETEESVRFLNSMGTVSMPRSRIESIERESEEANAKLREKWEQKKKKARVKKPEPAPEPAKKKELPVRRTYNIEITRRRIMLGGRATGTGSDQQVASFVIKDMGMVKGSRLFDVKVTSHKSGANSISQADFHALLRNDFRIDPEPLEGHAELDARLNAYETASGCVAFSTDANLETLVLRSQIANFKLDLETGKFTTRSGPF